MEYGIFRPGGLTLTKKYTDGLLLSPASAVLDIGCGTGQTMQLLRSEYRCAVSGADLSREAVRQARLLVPDADIRCEDAAALSFADGSFDAALMECTLTLFEDPAAALREAFRLLKTNGRLMISSMTGTGPEAVSGGRADPDRLTALLRQTGFSEISYFDEKYALTQFFCDIVFEYGSMQVWQQKAEAALGGIVLNCCTDRKGLSYGVFVCRK